MNRVTSEGRAGSRQSNASCPPLGSSISRAPSEEVEKRLRPKRANGDMRGQPSLSVPSLQQRLNDKRGRRDQVTLDQRSRNSQDTKTSLRELPVASSVVSALRLVALVPVNLHNERGLVSYEISDVISDHDLTPKLHAKQPASPHQAPHQRFSVSGILAKRPGALFEERFAVGTLS